ncbi:hypothetical protein SVIOM74S_04106 [Streptomyces violarus]
MPVREESQRERAERLAQERTEYAHVIVDEAQDLTPMQWRMVGRRGRHATWTVVGDPAQSSWSDPDEAAQARDEALGTRPRRRFELTVNYRNPAEIAELASKVLALAMPGSASPKAVRSTGVEPRFTVVDDTLAETVRAEAARLLERVDGTVGVVVAMQRREEARRWLAGLGDRVVALGSLEAKGLEYDATVVVSPAEIADESPAGLRVLYVALTRATRQPGCLGRTGRARRDGSTGPAQGLIRPLGPTFWTDRARIPTCRRNELPVREWPYGICLLAWTWHRPDPGPGDLRRGDHDRRVVLQALRLQAAECHDPVAEPGEPAAGLLAALHGDDHAHRAVHALQQPGRLGAYGFGQRVVHDREAGRRRWSGPPSGRRSPAWRGPAPSRRARRSRPGCGSSR